MTSTHTLICLAAGAGIAIAGAHVRQAIETATTHTEPPMQYHDAEVRRPLAAAPQPKALTLDDLFAAIAQVETGGEADPDHAIGDGGRSRGRYQIGFDYWRDAWPSTVKSDEYADDVAEPYMARMTMRKYWLRYAPAALAALDFETLARVHNGGPRGAEKESTLAYWAKVKAQLEAMP